jgi:organic radical activating enzyme
MLFVESHLGGSNPSTTAIYNKKMSEILKTNKTFCLAPWIHSFISPQGERKLCCISENVIGTNVPLDEMWNGDEMKDVRKKMLNGETLKTCDRCNVNQSSPIHTYRDYFNNGYPELIDDVISRTNEDGTFNGLPVALSYQTNICNFKCKMCYEGYSSQIQSEKTKNGIEINVLSVSERERSIEIIKNELNDEKIYKNILEIYWAGGEPLYWDVHWETLQMLIDKDCAKNVTLRYNTNLSIIEYKGKSIYEYFKHFKYVHFSSSIDGTGNIGEWIRSNLNYIKWKDNFSKIIKAKNEHDNINVFISITVTTATIFDFENLYELCKEFDIIPAFQTCYNGEVFNLMTPRAFPKKLIKPVLDKFLNNHLDDDNKLIDTFREYIEFLLNQHYHENDEGYIETFKKGIDNIKYLEKNRPHQNITFEDILSYEPLLYEFYKNFL